MPDKSVIVTGAADGLGRATSIAAARAGYSVLLVDIDVLRLAETERLVGEAGGHVAVAEADVSDAEAVKGFVNAALDAFGRIDGLFNNAGILGPMAPIADYSEEDFDRVISINLKGVFLGLKYVLPVMVKQGAGSIVNNSSMNATAGVPNLAAYNAAKHGILGLTQTAALEVAKAGVRVNAVLPGPIKTKMSLRDAPGVTEEEQESFAASLVPQGHMGLPEDIAETVIFLLSDQARFITGTGITVDGGVTAKI